MENKGFNFYSIENKKSSLNIFEKRKHLKIAAKLKLLDELILYYFPDIDLKSSRQFADIVAQKAFYSYFYKTINNNIILEVIAKSVNRDHSMITNYINNIEHYKYGKYFEIFKQINKKLDL